MKLFNRFSAILPSLSCCLTLLMCASAHADRNAFPRLMYNGRTALARENWTAAASSFRGALSYDPRSADAHAALGTAYLHLVLIERAQDEYTAALRLNIHCAEAERGLHLLRTTDQEAAAFKALEEQVKREPNNADLHTSYAEELTERDRFDEAQKEAETALRLKPHLGHAYCALARVAIHKGNDVEARKDFTIAIQADKRDDDAVAGLGDLAMKEKDYKAAVALYRRAVTIVPDERQWHEKLRDALAAAGDSEGAAQENAILAKLSKPASAH